MSPRRSAALVDAGVFLQLSGDVTGARELFRQALTLDPENKKAKVLLGADPVQTLPAAADAAQTLPPSAPPLPREAAPGNETLFAPPALRERSPVDATMVGRPLFPSERARIAGHLADGAFDKALGVTLERTTAIRRGSWRIAAKAGGGARRAPTVARWRRECDWRRYCPGCGTGSGR